MTDPDRPGEDEDFDDLDTAIDAEALEDAAMDDLDDDLDEGDGEEGEDDGDGDGDAAASTKAASKKKKKDDEDEEVALPDTPVLANTGVKHDTVAEVLALGDGCVVGSALKVDGDTWNAVDADRARDFMDRARAAR